MTAKKETEKPANDGNDTVTELLNDVEARGGVILSTSKVLDTMEAQARAIDKGLREGNGVAAGYEIRALLVYITEQNRALKKAIEELRK